MSRRALPLIAALSLALGALTQPARAADIGLSPACDPSSTSACISSLTWSHDGTSEAGAWDDAAGLFGAYVFPGGDAVSANLMDLGPDLGVLITLVGDSEMGGSLAVTVDNLAMPNMVSGFFPSGSVEPGVSAAGDPQVVVTATLADFAAFDYPGVGGAGVYLAGPDDESSLLGAGCAAALEAAGAPLLVSTNAVDYDVTAGKGGVTAELADALDPGASVSVSAPVEFFTSPACGWGLDASAGLAGQISATLDGAALGTSVSESDGVVTITVTSGGTAAVAAVATAQNVLKVSPKPLVKRVRKAQQVAATPSRVKVGKTAALPSKTRQGLALSWASTTPRTCSVSRGRSGWQVRGKKAGACALTGNNAGSADFLPLSASRQVTVSR